MDGLNRLWNLAHRITHFHHVLPRVWRSFQSDRLAILLKRVDKPNTSFHLHDGRNGSSHYQGCGFHQIMVSLTSEASQEVHCCVSCDNYHQCDVAHQCMGGVQSGLRF